MRKPATTPDAAPHRGQTAPFRVAIGVVLAASAGVMVWDEVPVYRLGEDQLKLHSVQDKGLTDIREMIERDQNHPSVLTWAIGNELPSRPDSGQEEYIKRAHALIDGQLHAGDDGRKPSFDPSSGHENAPDLMG